MKCNETGSNFAREWYAANQPFISFQLTCVHYIPPKIYHFIFRCRMCNNAL